MKRVSSAVLLLSLALPALSPAAEFQPLGAVGIGGAGVARSSDANAAYWNPAGLAFYSKPFSARLKGGAGISINSSLADNTDKLGKLDVTDLNNLSFNPAVTPAAALSATGKAVEFIGIINNLDRNKGNLAVTPGGFLALQYRNFALGAVVSSELGAFATTELVNVRPGDPTTSTLANFATGIAAAAGRPAAPLLSTAQYNQVVTAFGGNAQATAITDTLERQLKASNSSGQSPQQLTEALLLMARSFGTPGGQSIENNTTSIELRGLMLTEIPLAYGHKFDLGPAGMIGIGAAVKVMLGTAYASSQELVKIKDSNDLVKRVTDRQTDSINFGVDLGLLWRYAEMLNVGLVAKNLNSPQFDLPQFTQANTATFINQKVTVEPQLRLGMALEPLSWLTIAADCDLTSNKTVLPGKKNQKVGGGVDIHPLGWLALRLGMYGNLADSSTGPVGTAGFSLGPDWLRLDLDGAMSFETGKFKDSTYPREAKLEFGLSTMF